MVSVSRMAVLRAAVAAVCTKLMSLVSLETSRPGVSRDSRAKSALIRWEKATRCMSVVSRMTMRLVSTVWA